MWEGANVIRYVDYCAAGSAVGLCVVLPGTRYTPDGPLLFFAAQAALMRGWDVRQVWWDVPEMEGDEEVAWVGDQLDAAVGGHTGPVLVVAKSLGTLAASRAALRGYDAAWLTPLLTESDLAAPLLSYPARQFVVVGSDDPFFDEAVFDALPGEGLSVPGDHILRIAGDASGMVASHDRFVRSFDAWLGTAPK